MSLFGADVLAGAILLLATWGFLWSRVATPTALPRDGAVFWVVAAILALLTFGIGWNVRAETRAGRKFGVGILLLVLSCFPLTLGIAMLAWFRG